MKIFNPTAILHSGQICLKYWETEEPNPHHYGQLYEFQSAHNDWLSSARIVPFRDEKKVIEIIANFYSCFEGETGLVWNQISKGIPLDSIADRIQVVQPDNDSSTQFEPFAVINPVEVVYYKNDDLSLFGNYILINNIRLTSSNKVEDVIQEFLKSDYYLKRKTNE